VGFRFRVGIAANPETRTLNRQSKPSTNTQPLTCLAVFQPLVNSLGIDRSAQTWVPMPEKKERVSVATEDAGASCSASPDSCHAALLLGGRVL